MDAGEPQIQTKTLHVYVAGAALADGRMRMDALFTDTRGRILLRIHRVLSRTATRELGIFQGILYALWTPLGLGATRVVVHSDNVDVVRQINGDADVDPTLVGPYLQVRALLHAYRSARVQADHEGCQEALAIAGTTQEPDSDELTDGLPLWAGAAMSERSTA